MLLPDCTGVLTAPVLCVVQRRASWWESYRSSAGSVILFDSPDCTGVLWVQLPAETWSALTVYAHSFLLKHLGSLHRSKLWEIAKHIGQPLGHSLCQQGPGAGAAAAGQGHAVHTHGLHRVISTLQLTEPPDEAQVPQILFLQMCPQHEGGTGPFKTLVGKLRCPTSCFALDLHASRFTVVSLQVPKVSVVRAFHNKCALKFMPALQLLAVCCCVHMANIVCVEARHAYLRV